MRRMKRDDIPQVVILHRDHLDGFLSQLGPLFLSHVYRASLGLSHVITLVEEKDGVVVGFVMGVTRGGGLIRDVIRHDLLWFIWFFLWYSVTHPLQAIKIVRAMTYPGLSQSSAELLSLAVDEREQGHGVGKRLFLALSHEFSKQSISSFLISAYTRLPSNGFYIHIGCKKEKKFSFLGETMQYYRYTVQG